MLSKSILLNAKNESLSLKVQKLSNVKVNNIQTDQQTDPEARNLKSFIRRVWLQL